jgi:hypothetical protein
MPMRNHASHNATPTGPSLRTTVVASAAAIGAVATGTFTALMPTSSGTPTAAADQALPTTLAANTMALPQTAHVADFVPVAFTSDDNGNDDGNGSDGGDFASADQHLAMLGKAADIASKLAADHAKQAEADRLNSIIAHGGVDGWIAEALHVLKLPQSLAPSVKRIIMKESGGNPRAINNWDSNARAGTPSQGLMQTIPTTFRHYVAPSLASRGITDPVANITAGVNYMIANYGIGTLQAGGRSDGSGGYVGY